MISNDLRGHSGVILHSVESMDALYEGIPVAGISANVADNDESFIVVTESGGVSTVTEDITGIDAGLILEGEQEGWDYDTYTVALTRALEDDEVVTISVLSSKPGPEDEAKGYRTIEFLDPETGSPHENLQLTFTGGSQGNWQTAQEVKFRAVHDDASEGRQFALINHKVESSIATSPYHQLAMRSVKVQINDDDRAGAIVTPTGRSTLVIEGGMTDTYAVVLTRMPTADVTVTLDAYFDQVSLSASTLTFTSTNYNVAQIVTVTAVDDDLKEGFHTDYITHTLTSADVDQTVPTGWYQIDGDPLTDGVNAIPSTNPLDTVLLQHKPIAGIVAVEVDDVLRDATRFEVIGNTLVFLDEFGSPEAISGKLEVSYNYLETGYNNAPADRVVVDVADNEVGGVVVLESDGSTDVVEGGATDTYEIVLTKAPTANVTIDVDAIKTRTTGSNASGNFAFFEEQVQVDGASLATLTFTPTNWSMPQTVTVSAIDDDRVDGSDTQVFVPGEASLNGIRGPVFIEGAAGAGSLSLPEPLMLKGERNIRPTDGNVVGFQAGTGPGAIELMTVETADLLEVVDDVSELMGRTLELTKGPGTGVVLDSGSGQALDRFWMILEVSEQGESTVLTLQNPSQVDPGDPAVTAPDWDPENLSEYAITSLSVNFFADEASQVDYLFVYDQDSVADDVGEMTSELMEFGEGEVTKGRITGLGMGPDAIIGGSDWPGGITYGDLEVVQVNLGSGDDDLTVDYASYWGDHTTQRSSEFYTLTMVNTGEGDDTVTVNLDAGKSGAFALNTQSGDDTVFGAGSTAPLIVFGEEGNDTIHGGDGADILFGDYGRVDYVDGGESIVTRLGHTWVQNPVNPPVSSATAKTLTDTTAFFPTTYGDLVGLSVQVISPEGDVQYRRIVANTGTEITVDSDWDVTPDEDYFYRVSMLPEDQTDGVVRGPRVAWSIHETVGGNDTLYGNDGADLIVGGAAGDTVEGGDGGNLIAGDNVRFDFAPVTGADGATGLAVAQTTSPDVGAADTISAGVGNGIILGGQGGDQITSGGGNNILVGDEARIFFYLDGNFSDIDFIESLSTTDEGGADDIIGGAGSDLIIGGRFGDTIDGGSGNNLVLGDSGEITAASTDGPQLDGIPMTFGQIKTIADGIGGSDFITAGIGNDILIGGTNDEAVDERITAGDGNNIVLGDSGRIDFTRADREGGTGADTNPTDIDFIESSATTQYGGVDVITSGTGSDLVIGGRYGDTIHAGRGNNLVIGDSGRITAASTDGPQLAGIPMTFGRIETMEFGHGGRDTISTLGGRDIVFGGHEGDVIDAGAGRNIVFGDDGQLYYTLRDWENTPGADKNPGDIDLIESLSTDDHGGWDWITTGAGNDIVIGGRFADEIDAGDGDNLVIGDSGRITAADVDAPQFGVGMTYGLIETMEFGDGGSDTITTGSGSDIILGGHNDDANQDLLLMSFVGGGGLGETIDAGDGNNIVFGDNGKIDYARSDRGGTESGADADPSDMDLIESISTMAWGGSDGITTGAGSDIVIGGRYGDVIDAGGGDNLVIGDSGRITASDSPLRPWIGQPISVGVVETIPATDGGSDTVTTLDGDDILLGGTAGDTIYAGAGVDMIFGDQGRFRATGGANKLANYWGEIAPWFEGYTYTATDIDDPMAGDNDWIEGGAGGDYILGQQGSDIIFGGAGDDDIYGGHNQAGGLDAGDVIDAGAGYDAV
ncbi:MAG: calcium-binding protein, partial [Desulfococcus multivorans]|nr:calcium-binding protein [Desulfococcus multivorans]